MVDFDYYRFADVQSAAAIDFEFNYSTFLSNRCLYFLSQAHLHKQISGLQEKKTNRSHTQVGFLVLNDRLSEYFFVLVLRLHNLPEQKVLCQPNS